MSKSLIASIVAIVTIAILIGIFFLVRGDSGGKVSECEGDIPTFTHMPTNLERITQITPPLMRVMGDVKTHSYIDVLKQAPIYAPVDAQLTNGAKYKAVERGLSEQYSLNFEVGCGISFYIDHLVDPILPIADKFPGPVQEDTRGQFLSPIEVKAGQLIGYSAGTGRHNWDFGVLDARQETVLADNPDYNWSNKYRHAVCPYVFYETEVQDKVKALYSYDNHSDLEVIDNLCD